MKRNNIQSIAHSFNINFVIVYLKFLGNIYRLKSRIFLYVNCFYFHPARFTVLRNYLFSW